MYNKSVLAIILGGGQGTRLYPLTEKRSKPAVPIAGKYRLVDIPISNCLNADIKRIFVLTQFNSASLNQHIKNTYHFSIFSSAFVNILAAEQTPENKTWFQGTADAVRQCMQHLANHDFDYVLILSGDQLYQMDFNEMIENHLKNDAEISVATLPVKAEEATSFGILKTDIEDVITAFIEKPKAEKLLDWTSEVSKKMKTAGRMYLASMGIYLFNRKTLIRLMEQTEMVDFGKEIIPQSIDQCKTLSFPFEGYWTDIGNVSSFFEANLGLTDKLPKFNLYNETQKVYTRARILPTSKISGTLLDKAVIAEGCIIEAEKIVRSVIGIRSRIGAGTKILNTYMMGSDRYESVEDMEKNKKTPCLGIGKKCVIENAILDKNCRIGDDVKIIGGKHLKHIETESLMVKDGIVVIKKEAVIPNGFQLGY